MKVVVMGCGRIGSTVAVLLDRSGHEVSVIDRDEDAFRTLPHDFGGKQILGTGIDQDVLRQAGIETADALVAVSSGQNSNVMAAQVAKEIFGCPRAIVRINDPIRQRTFEQLGLETFCLPLTGVEIIMSTLNVENGAQWSPP